MERARAVTEINDQWRLTVASTLGRIEATQVANTETHARTDLKLNTIIAEVRETKAGITNAQQGITGLHGITSGHEKRLAAIELRMTAVEGMPWKMVRRIGAGVLAGGVAVWSVASDTASHVLALWISSGKH